MLNIQLYLENQEVELNNKVQFPLTKEFEHLSNPTDILVEYSKSINIPASKINNRIMANAYRLDRKFANNDSTENIGLQLDPLKRIPMKLIYNGDILLDGYAKYASSTISNKNTYYTFNLYGAIGDIFQTLMDCVVDENKLTDEQKAEEDGGAKYVINQLWEDAVIDKEFIKDSWSHEDVVFDDLMNPHNSIGFAPAYRGLYDKFESNSIVGLGWTIMDGNADNLEPKSIEEQLKTKWISKLVVSGKTKEEAENYVNSLDFNAIISKGLSEHQMQQFRSYEQKPYIYMHALMTMFRNKCKELTDYEIKLDNSWFSVNNPYYANMCYMLDYLSVKGNSNQGISKQFTGQSKAVFSSEYPSNDKVNTELVSQMSFNITNQDIVSGGDIVLEPITFGVELKKKKNASHVLSNCKIKMNKNTEVLINVAVTIDGSTKNYYYWGGTGKIGVKNEIMNPNPSRYNSNNFIYMFEETTYDKKSGELIGKSYITVPKMVISHPTGGKIDVKYSVSLYCPLSGGVPYYGNYYYGNDIYANINPALNNSNYRAFVTETNYLLDWRNSTNCSLKNIYTRDEPLFNIVLQYTKMMGLIWKPDYKTKTIEILTKETYFKDYKILDWTKKVDKSKGMTIEPASFNTKYVVFNYADVKGNHYTGYKDKFGVNYGEKKMRTKYSFDTKEEKLFKEKINPSCVSCKSISLYDDLVAWNAVVKLPVTQSEINFIDCEDDNKEKPISINNWYFRNENKSTNRTYLISDITSKEIGDGKSYWYDTNFAVYKGYAITTKTLPQFSPVYKSDVNAVTVGCLFNCPNEEYTFDNSMANAKGNYIYDICWADYINERYNANNKKLTCYIRLTPDEFKNFNYKTFVVIDNQLFIVNKITDYDVKNPTTKVELIQVTNINGYTTSKFDFPQIIFDNSTLTISPIKDYASGVWVGATSLKVRSYPTATVVRLTPMTPISIGTECSVEGAEHIGNTIDFDIRYTATSIVGTEIWNLVIEQNGIQYEILITINATK